MGFVSLNNLKKSGKYKSLHGVYSPKNKEKYKSNNLPHYKSKLELKTMVYLDNNPNVINWCYEPFAIEYYDKSPLLLNRTAAPIKRKYYIDFAATIKTANGTQKVWIEVKSKNDVNVVMAPTKIMESQAYIKNMSKWTAAKKMAKEKGYNFVIITDNDLKNL